MQAFSIEVTGDTGLAEDHFCTLVGVIRIHRNVGGSGGHDGQDCQVELAASRRHPHTNAVAATDALFVEPRSCGINLVDQLRIRDDNLAVIDGLSLGEPSRGRPDNVNECALKRLFRSA